MGDLTAPSTILDLALRLAAAVAMGAAIGLNREIEMKPAGLRTHALVSLGAALFMVLGLVMGGVGPNRDPSATSRVIQGLLAGIGFIGGGVIMHRGDGKQVYGLTTAVSIWVCAAIGVAAGAGQWAAGAVTVVLTLAVLMIGAPIDRKLRGRNPPN